MKVYILRFLILVFLFSAVQVQAGAPKKYFEANGTYEGVVYQAEYDIELDSGKLIVKFVGCSSCPVEALNYDSGVVFFFRGEQFDYVDIPKWQGQRSHIYFNKVSRKAVEIRIF